MHFDRRLWAFTRGLRGWIAAAILMGLIASVIGIARFVLLGVLLSHVFRGAGWVAVALPAVGVAAAVILRGWIEQQRAIVSHRTADRVQQNLRGRLYDKIAELGPAWFAGERTGGVMLSIVDGVEQLQSFFGQYVPQLSIAVLTPLAIFVFIAFWDVPVAAVMLAFALFTLIAPTVFLQNERRSSHDRQQTLKAFGSEFLDGVQGLPTLKAFGQSTAYGRRLAARAGELCTSTLRVLGFSVMTRGITDCGVAIGAAAALALGVWRVSHGEMSLQALLIVLMAGTEIFRPLRDLRTVLHQGMVGQSAGAGINALLAAEPLVPPQPASPAPAVALAPTIAFEDVHFAYPGGRGAAHDGLAFNVAAGEKIGIVGPSGSGKSSVARLLAAPVRPAAGPGADRRARSEDARSRGGAPDDRGGAPGHLPVPRHGRGEFAARQARCRPAGDRGRGARRQRARIHRGIAAGLPDDDRRARRHAVGRPAPAPGDRPRALARRADPDPRRGAVLGRCRKRGGDPAGDRPALGRTHDTDPGASAVERDRRRPHPGAGPAAASSNRAGMPS